MVDGSNTETRDRLTGLAYLAIIVVSSAGCLATTRLLAGDLNAPFACAADIGGIGTCAWLLIAAPAPSSKTEGLR